MTIVDYLGWIGTNIIAPLFNFNLVFWGVTFGGIVVAIFGLPILVRAIKKIF